MAENKQAVQRQHWFVRMLQAVLRWLIGNKKVFFEMLEAQARIANDAAQKLKTLATREPLAVAAEVQVLEHEGDAMERKVEEALASTFVTPLDREDLQRLSSGLDNVLDFSNSAVRSCQMRGVNKVTPPMLEMIGKLAEMTVLLCETVGKLRKHDYGNITVLARKVQKLESDGDVHYRGAIAALYAGGDVMQILREESVLKDLEKALNSAEDLADTLINVAVKHG